MYKRGQVTIFIIVAILIVAAVALVLILSPKIRTSLGLEKPAPPQVFIQTCLEDTITENAKIISLQGGSLNPEFFYLYQGEKLQYLCYTNEYYKLCTAQVPFLRSHIEEQLKTSIEAEVAACFDSLKENYEKQGYTNVNMRMGTTKVELLPQRVLTSINTTFVASKEESTEKYDSFRIVLNNNLYELVAIAQNIMEWETIYGEADPKTYMLLYPDLKVEKLKQTDETKIYIITDKNTQNKFQFASRSLAFPPGY